MRKHRSRAARAAASLGLAGLVVGLAACAGSDSSAPQSSAVAEETAEASSEPTGEAPADDAVAAASTNVDQWFANSSAPMDTTGLLENNLQGKKLFYLSSYLSSPSGTAGVDGLNEAAEALGISFTVFDGAYSPAKFQEGLNQALSGGYDGVILYGVDCPGIEQPLKQLREANIPVASISGADCNAVDPSAEPLFTADVAYPLGDGRTGNSVDIYRAWGASQADYVIARTNGQAKAILFEVPDFYVTKALADGFRERFAECTTCSIVETVNVLAEDFGPNLAQKSDQALLKHPDANTIVAAYDDLLTLGLANSVVQTGRADDMLVVGGTGLEPAIELIKDGKGNNAGWGYDYTWDHYAAVAALMSAFEGQPAPAVGTPVMWYDEEHNLPASGAFVPDFDFRAAFEKAWLGQQ